MQDVLASRNEVIYTNVNIIVESLQDENDISFLRNCLNGFSNEHIIEYNYSTSLSFDIKVPIIRDGTNLDFSKDLLIIEGKNNNDNSTKIHSKQSGFNSSWRKCGHERENDRLRWLFD